MFFVLGPNSSLATRHHPGHHHYEHHHLTGRDFTEGARTTKSLSSSPQGGISQTPCRGQHCDHLFIGPSQIFSDVAVGQISRIFHTIIPYASRAEKALLIFSFIHCKTKAAQRKSGSFSFLTFYHPDARVSDFMIPVRCDSS